MTRLIAITGINPEPWTAPEVSIGRKGGKVYPMVYKTSALRSYQEAIQDDLKERFTSPVVGPDVPIRLRFWFWRQLPDYEIGEGRKSRRHVADVTNLQKSLEDALQKIVFPNDRMVLDIQSTIVAQAPDTIPCIVISVEPLRNPPVAPAEVDELYTMSLLKVIHKRDDENIRIIEGDLF